MPILHRPNLTIPDYDYRSYSLAELEELNQYFMAMTDTIRAAARALNAAVTELAERGAMETRVAAMSDTERAAMLELLSRPTGPQGIVISDAGGIPSGVEFGTL